MTALSWSVLVIGATLTLLLFAFVVRRLIGVRLPPLRTLAAAIIAVLVFSPIVTAMIGGPGFPRKGSALPALWFVILGAVIALLAGMVFLVIAEALVPSGSVPGPVYVLRAARGRMGRARRYWQISRILARRGLLPYARGGRRSELATPEGRARLARSVRLAMEDGGVTFVKLGQVLSTRRDLLPAEFIGELSRLQDDAAGVPWPAIEQVLRSELGAEVDELFASFDRSRSPPRPSPRSTRRLCCPGPGSWSRYAARTSARRWAGTWISPGGWRPGWSAAPAGAGRSARPGWPPGSPPPCAKNSTCG